MHATKEKERKYIYQLLRFHHVIRAGILSVRLMVIQLVLTYIIPYVIFPYATFYQITIILNGGKT